MANTNPVASPHPNIRALKAAFPHTLPVLAGFLFLGMAYGVLMTSKGFSWVWSLLMSTCVFAGSMQFVAVTLLTAAFNPLYAFLLTLMVNARHLFYGIAMLGKYKGTGKAKPYLIFALCDETFSILCSAEPPAGVSRTRFMLFVALLDQAYWVLGSLLGGIAGQFIPFNTEGLDFALTALFVVILVNQWKSTTRHAPVLIGLGCSVLALLLFGPDNFLIPAMALIGVVLTLCRNPLSKEEQA